MCYQIKCFTFYLFNVHLYYYILEYLKALGNYVEMGKFKKQSPK